MIQALMEGRKTQTRRVLKPQPSPGVVRECIMAARDIPNTSGFAVGDRLWVRESCAFVGSVDPQWVLYRASGYARECRRHGFDLPYPPEPKWRPSIHMSRGASRLTLTVTGVRVERVQDISAADATAEGLAMRGKGGSKCKYGIPDRDGQPGNEDHGWLWQDWCIDPRNAFGWLWNSIYEARGYGWAENPWVVALTFTVSKHNIDRPKEGNE